MGNNTTEIRWFHQSANKEVRIFTRASEVMNLTYMPEGWETLYPEFHAEISGFRRKGKNAHDDGADCLTGCVEKRGEFDYESYDDIDTGGMNSIVEIHPMINGKFVYVKVYVVDGGVYVEETYIGNALALDNISSLVKDAEVNIEAPNTMLHYVRDYRASIGEVWARQERNNKFPYIESFKALVSGFKFKRSPGMEGFMRNLMDYDGKDVYEAMYVLCCIADRAKERDY